jgi:hypothetical protein
VAARKTIKAATTEFLIEVIIILNLIIFRDTNELS